MRAYLSAICVSLVAATAFGAEPSAPSVIPAPQKMEVSNGQFTLSSAAQIDIDAPSAATGEFLAAKLRAATGYRIPLYTNNASDKGAIQLTTKNANASLGAEGYELNVTPDAVTIKAPAQAGLFYGVQTLLQLFPPQIFASAPATNVHWQIPFAVHIEDQPRFPWRGFMLDVSRHFFSKSEVERVLDLMALHKLNMFHWHLTDDQGWRIEIKKYPKLTQIGAWRDQSLITPPNGDDGHRQADHIHPAWDVVPKIEMPGHAIAALAAYPELSCDGGSYSVNVQAGVNKGVFCVGKDGVFTFLQNVLLEVFQLFPGKYIHVGGDEVNAAIKKDTWGKSPECLALMKAHGLKTLDELQGWFTGKIGQFIADHGKIMIGWTEIAESPLPPNAIVMDWQGGALAA